MCNASFFDCEILNINKNSNKQQCFTEQHKLLVFIISLLSTNKAALRFHFISAVTVNS